MAVQEPAPIFAVCSHGHDRLVTSVVLNWSEPIQDMDSVKAVESVLAGVLHEPVETVQLLSWRRMERPY